MTLKEVAEKAALMVGMYHDNEDCDVDVITRLEKELPYNVLSVNATLNPFVSIYTGEAKMLDKLLKALFNQAEKDLKHNTDSDIIIIIGDEVVRLGLGGPQIDGMLALIYHIAGENFYDVDVENRTVKGDW
jgi:hypothetical protein